MAGHGRDRLNRPLDFTAAKIARNYYCGPGSLGVCRWLKSSLQEWGLVTGRSLPGPLNSAVVRVSDRHASLLQAWHSLLETDTYIAEQAVPSQERNQHLLGDQDGLSALLASEEFAGFPVCRLRHATDILQHHGSGCLRTHPTMGDTQSGLPLLVHATEA